MYLPIRLPVFWDETRRRLRGGRGFAVMAGYLAALVGILIFLVMTNPVSSDAKTWPDFGRNLWHFILFGQLIALVFIAPGLTAGAVSAERERRTLDLLFLTPQSTLALALGKYLGAITQLLVVILAGLPVVAVVFFFGGVSPQEVAKGYLFILACALFYGGLGFLASCLCARVAAAVAWAYGFMLIYTLGLPLVITVLVTFLPDMLGFSDQVLFSISGPLTVLLSYGSEGHFYWMGIISAGVEILVLLAAGVLLLRRLRGASPLEPPKRRGHAVPITPEPADPSLTTDH